MAKEVFERLFGWIPVPALGNRPQYDSRDWKAGTAEERPRNRSFDFFADEDAEIAFYGRSPFTAWEHALQRGCHHPGLWEVVKGSPFEHLYRERFNIPREQD